MSTFILFGASGATGAFLLPRLRAAGAQVHAVSREPRPSRDERLHWVMGDLYGAVGALPRAADAIVCLGPLDAFADWFAATDIRARRVLALSSMSAQSKRESPDPAERALAARLRAAETRLAQAADARATGWTIFRPTLIYGDGRDRSLAPIARFARRWRVLPVPIGARGLRQPLHADDLAAAVAAALERPAALGKTYALGGGERLRFDAMLRRIAGAIPGFVLPLPVPVFLLRALARHKGFGPGAIARLREALVADNRDAERDFGYAPRAFIAADVFGHSEPSSHS